MQEDYREQHRKSTNRVRSFMDYIMGTLLFFVGVWFMIYDRVGINVFNREPSQIDYFIGAMFMLYGIWRIYRGYKKNY